MTRRILQTILAAWALALASSSAHAAAPDLSGTWQTSTPSPRVVKIEKASGGYRARMYVLDEWKGGGEPVTASMITTVHVQGSAVRFSLDRRVGSFDGTLSANGNTLTGTWRAYGQPGPMVLECADKTKAWTIDPSPHTSRMIKVDQDVSLEVLDWGGSGPPLVFLAGLGDTAHTYDKFAPAFTAKHHVYGITRRGYGASSTPAPTDANYDADRLGDDVLAVIDALKLDHPVLAGWSYGGAELSSIGTRHPEKVAGLVYMDGAFDYAFYEPKVPQGFPYEIVGTVRRDLARLEEAGPVETQALTDEILATLPALQDGLRAHAEQVKGQPEHPAEAATPEDLVERAVLLNMRKYTGIKPPFLVIAAVPHVCAPHCDTAGAKHDREWTAATADAIAADYPKARIVRIPYAKHDIFRSNEADVAREMNAFMDGLGKR